MAQHSGLRGYVGWKVESTYGTGVVPDSFVPWISQSMTDGIEYEPLVSEGIIAGNYVSADVQNALGATMLSGDISFEMPREGAAELIEFCMGLDTTSGVGPYTHTYSMADLKSFTLAVGVPENDATSVIRDFRFAGCKVSAFTFSVAARGYLRCTLSIVAKSVTTETALAPSFSTLALWKFSESDYKHGTVGAGASVCVDDWTLSGDNGLETDKLCLNQSTIDEPQEIGLRTYTVESSGTFENLNAYNAFAANTTYDFDLVATVGTDVLTFNGQGKFRSPGGPQMTDGGRVTQTYRADLVGGQADSDLALTVTLVNDEA